MTPARQAYEGVLIGNMGYSPIEAASAIENGQLRRGGLRRALPRQPRPPCRIKAGAQLNAADPNTFLHLRRGWLHRLPLHAVSPRAGPEQALPAPPICCLAARRGGS